MEVDPKRHDTVWCLGNALMSQAFLTPDLDVAEVIFKKASQYFQQAVDKVYYFIICFLEAFVLMLNYCFLASCTLFLFCIFICKIMTFFPFYRIQAMGFISNLWNCQRRYFLLYLSKLYCANVTYLVILHSLVTCHILPF